MVTDVKLSLELVFTDGRMTRQVSFDISSFQSGHSLQLFIVENANRNPAGVKSAAGLELEFQQNLAKLNTK